MKKILSLLIVLMGIFVLTGCRFSPKKVNINIPIDEKEYTKEELTNGITHEEFKALSGDFIVVAKNTNSVVVDLTFEVEYYDENNSLISKLTEGKFSLKSNNLLSISRSRLVNILTIFSK